MSREFKFRAWDLNKKEMLYFDGIFNKKPYTERSSFSQYESCPEYHKLEIMQYTGVKDKNGNKIYEGDLISYLSVSDQEISVGGEIIYDDRMSSYMVCFYATNMFEEDNILPLFDYEYENIEVIGNIYETPELLEGKQ
jgi:uncharacterized phage protein (TIGR01671 family)